MKECRMFFVQILFEVLAFCESFRSVSWSYIFIALEEGRLLTLSGTVSHLPTLLEEYLQSDLPIKLKDIFKRISSLLKHKGNTSITINLFGIYSLVKLIGLNVCVSKQHISLL